jgi:hypothetical protein
MPPVQLRRTAAVEEKFKSTDGSRQVCQRQQQEARLQLLLLPAEVVPPPPPPPPLVLLPHWRNDRCSNGGPAAFPQDTGGVLIGSHCLLPPQPPHLSADAASTGAPSTSFAST